MSGQMCWLGRPGEVKILHLRFNPHDVWLPYSHTNFAHLRKQDYPILNGNPGYSTVSAAQSRLDIREGEMMKQFICDFFYKGEPCSIHIPADSWEEAEAKMRQIGHGKIVGEIVAEVPIPTSLQSFIKRMARWISQK
jgi:hypothetical protein